MKTQIRAASYLGFEGYGNDLTGLRPWSSLAKGATQTPSIKDLHWSQFFHTDASRFARMDLMSRIGSLAVELLDVSLGAFAPEQRDSIAVYLETSAGCAATDFQFLQTPRPSVFTYTLPSTLLGEISIRYRLRGPMLCLIVSHRSQLLFEANDLIESGNADACVCISCEALDRGCETAAAQSEHIGMEWHSCALFLAREDLYGAEEPGTRFVNITPVGSLRDLCRSAVSASGCAGKPS